MYETHFGLKCRPFRDTVAADAYVPLVGHEGAIRRLRYAVEHCKGSAVLFGPPGSGKTIVANRLVSELGCPTTQIAIPMMSPDELFAFVAAEMFPGFTGVRPPVGDSLRRLRSGLAKRATQGQRPLLIIDEAQLIDDPQTFESLRLLENFTTGGDADISILFVGTPELLLKLPNSLSDRLVTRSLLRPFTSDETSNYIRGRLVSAGSNESPFSDQSLALLHRLADGLPRRLNRLADLSLLMAYSEDRTSVDQRMVEAAAAEYEPYGSIAALRAAVSSM